MCIQNWIKQTDGKMNNKKFDQTELKTFVLYDGTKLVGKGLLTQDEANIKNYAFKLNRTNKHYQPLKSSNLETDLDNIVVPDSFNTK